MGEVWLASKSELEKPCVVKVLLAKYSRDPEYRRRFFREASILAKLRHSRVVSIIDFGECEGWLYIAMDYIDGVDLGRFCRAITGHGEALPVSVAAYVIGEVLEALRHAHRRAPGGRPLGIIHRDITPGNVIISSEGEVFLTDFGLARHDADLSGDVFGTLEYLAPEQADGSACCQSDLYGVGGLLHFMLTGRPPRKARNASEMMANLRPAIGDLGRDDVAEPILRLLRLCLEPDVVNRIGSANEGILLLDSWPAYHKETTVTAQLYQRHVGPPRTGLTGIIAAAVSSRSAHADEGPWIPRVEPGGTLRLAAGGTLRVERPLEVVVAARPRSGPSPSASEPVAVAAPEPSQPELLWRAWWVDADDDCDEDEAEEGATTRVEPPRELPPRPLPPLHLAEPDAPRLFRRPHGAVSLVVSELLHPCSIGSTEHPLPPASTGTLP